MEKLTVADVTLWGRRIGAVSWDYGRGVSVFEYDSKFLKAQNLELSPFKMEKRGGTFSFPGENFESFKGLPGMLADSLPDKFGNALIDSWLAKNGRRANDFSPVERLCYIGSRGMGALEFSPATSEKDDTDSVDISIKEMVELASKVLSDREKVNERIDLEDEDGTGQSLKNLFLIGSSAGGARAKCLIAYNKTTGDIRSGQVDNPKGFEYYLLKLDGVEMNKDKELNDPLGYGRSEFAYYKMAIDCGILMSECELITENGRAHFMTKRFDRVNGKKLHMQSLCGLRHYDFNQPGAHSYEQALETIRTLVNVGKKNALEQQFRRAVFNVIARNQDDHTKNINFLMDQKGMWSLSPAFDIAYSYNPSGKWTSKHQMQINGKRDGFSIDDFISLGKKADLSEKKVKNIIVQTTQIVSQWKKYFENCEVPEKIIKGIDGTLRLDILDLDLQDNVPKRKPKKINII